MATFWTTLLLIATSGISEHSSTRWTEYSSHDPPWLWLKSSIRTALLLPLL